MKNIRYIVAVFVLIGSFFGAPHASDAYFTTAQNAFTVNGSVGVYTIDFRFGHTKHDVLIPIRAMSTTSLFRDALSYEVRDVSGKLVPGSSVGVVLGDVPIKDGMYVIQKGTSARLTLLVLHTRDASTPIAETVLQVTQLPFSFNGAQQLQLNPSELKHYITPSATLDGVIHSTY